MSQWFYAEGNRQQHGPLAADALIAMYQAGRITLDTLVWRDGMAQWQALASVAAELGLDTTASIIPAVEAGMAGPPQPPALPDAAAAPAPAAAAPAYTMPPPRKGLSGCAIVGIIAAVVLVVLLGIAGILAAIALPAYQQYTHRAKVTQARAQLSVIQSEVAAFAHDQGRCPVNDDEGFQAAERYADGPVGAVRIGRFDNGHCGIEAELSVPGSAALEGKLLWLDFDPDQGSWECSGEPDDTYLPADCRG